MISIKLCILLAALSISCFTIHLTYGLPILKVFNSINIQNVLNFENKNDKNNNDNNNDDNNNDDRHNSNNNNNNNDNVRYSNNFDNNEYKLISLDKNYTINSTVIRHTITYNPLTRYFIGEIILSYNNNFDNHFNCKIDINPPNQTTNTYIQNYIYYEYNLGKLINLTCNYQKCIVNTKYYNFKYKFNYFTCNIKLSKYVNDEF